jgi:ribosomal protein S18 acetylase RimI-like enzyme
MNQATPVEGIPSKYFTALIRLRSVLPQDAEFLYRVFSSTREREVEFVPWDAGQKETFLRSQFHAQRVHYEKYFPNAAHDIILKGEQPAGRLYVDRTDKADHIVDIALLSECRGAGIGTALLTGLLAEARDSGKVVRIHVEKQNPALRLYERLGFKIQSDAGIYFLMQWASNKEVVNG